MEKIWWTAKENRENGIRFKGAPKRWKFHTHLIHTMLTFQFFEYHTFSYSSFEIIGCRLHKTLELARDYWIKVLARYWMLNVSHWLETMDLQGDIWIAAPEYLIWSAVHVNICREQLYPRLPVNFKVLWWSELSSNFIGKRIQVEIGDFDSYICRFWHIASHASDHTHPLNKDD